MTRRPDPATRQAVHEGRCASSAPWTSPHDGVAPAELPRAWRAAAEQLRPYNPGAAVAFERAAAELEGALELAAGEALTLEEAERESGFSRDHLRHLVSQGRIRNAGRKGAPRIRRRDLPRRVAKAAGSGTYDAGADALSIVSKHHTA
jgi:hypothetical protein